MNSLDIIFSCDCKYINPLIAIINSILTNTASTNNLTFNILCDNTEFFTNKLQILKTVHKSNNFTFNCISLLDTIDKNDSDFINKYCFSPDSHTDSIYNFSRFWFSKLFPNLDYVIYLDIDMIIEGDIFELANFDFNDKRFFAAVLGTIKKNYKIKDMKIHNSLLKKYNISGNNLAFNAGLYVTSLSYWRKTNILDKLKEIVKLRFKKKDLYRFGTQVPLNIIFHNNMINIQDPNWMVSTLGWHKPCIEAINSVKSKKAKCLHWTGSKKPWNSDRFHGIYLKYLH